MWQWSRGGMGSVGHLPEAGGSQQQSCLNLAALSFCNHVSWELSEEDREMRELRSEQKRRRA
jgi:hypothetical protein